MALLPFIKRNPIFDNFNNAPTFEQPQFNNSMNMGAGMPMQDPFQPQTQFYDELLNTLRGFPEREEPSGMRKLGAYISGVGAGLKPQAIVGGQPIGASFDPEASTNTTEKFAYNPFYQKLTDIAAKSKLLEPGVNAENQMNQQNRILYDSRENRRIAQQKADDDYERDQRIYEKEQAQLDINRTNAATNAKRAAIQDFISKNRNKVFKTDDKGFIIAIDPLTNVSEQLLDATGNPVKSGDATDAQRIAMQLDASLELEGARQGNRIDLENTRSGNTLTEIGARGEEARATRSTPNASSSGSVTNMSPSQVKIYRQNKANDFKALNPTLAQFIKQDANGQVVIEPPGSGGIFGKKGPSQADYTKAHKYIFESEPPPARTSTATSTSTSPNSSTAKVKYSANGQTYEILAKDVAEFMKDFPNAKKVQ